jgi:hypothetical protein
MTIFLACCVFVLALWVVLLSRRLSSATEAIKMQEEKHRQQYAEFIAKVNHYGQVPIASTALGLIGLISLAMNRCLTWLEDLRKNKDWRTHSISTELSGIRSVELHMMENKLKELLQSIREVLEEHNHKQEE